MCNDLVARITPVINKFNEIIRIQEHNISTVHDKRIEIQIQRFRNTVEILNTSDVAEIVQHAEQISNEIDRNSSEQNVVDSNFDNWIILVNISNIISGNNVSWLEIQNTANNQNVLMETIRRNA